LDIGGSSIKAALVDDAGVVSWEGKSPRYSRPTLDELVSALRAAVEPCPVSLSHVGAVGMCVPGLLNAERTVVEKSVNLPALIGVPLDRIVDEVVGAGLAPRLSLVSDAHAAAYDVWSTERPDGRLLCLSLGTGVGASVLDDGVPLHVSGHSPGHLGQMDVSIDDHPPIGPDGGRGSLEAYIGLPALQQRHADRTELALASMTLDEPPILALARAIRVAHAIYRPKHIRLLGGVGIRLAPLVPALRERVAHQLTSVAREGWTLAAGATDFHAARGAARLAVRPRT
jgi:glucokinase